MIASYAEGCSINVPSFPFGNFDPNSPYPSDTAGQVGISCPAGTAFTVKLDAGRNSGGSFLPRKLIGPAGRTIDYYLTVDAARTQIWGDGTGGTYPRVGTASGNWDSIVCYGRIPARQNVPSGSYGDQVIVTVEW